MAIALTVDNVASLFQQEVSELQGEPDFQFSAERVGYTRDDRGAPDVKVAVANVPLDYDLWKGLRNPAIVGLHPIGLREIWDFYAHTTAKGVDPEGRATMFKIPRPYEVAQDRFQRAVLISVMLPFSQETLEAYAQTIGQDSQAALHRINQAYSHTDRSLDRATARVAMDLVGPGRAVVAMDGATVKRISTEAIPATRQGEAHGPSKGGNWPQKSIAVLTGLGQFGVARFVVRDEIRDDQVQRFVGPLRSIVIFDQDELVTEGRGGVICISDEWRAFLMRLYDFTDTAPEIDRYRQCTYLSSDDDRCQACLQSCRQGALANSMPGPAGRYPDRIQVQEHRFWEGQLQFDHARHREEINQMRALYPEWECMRCVAVCAAKGGRSESCVADLQAKMVELNVC